MPLRPVVIGDCHTCRNWLKEDVALRAKQHTNVMVFILTSLS
jgi:hypothetical protein